MPTLLDATAQTLQALGPRRFSLTAVAETAGVSRGTVYNALGNRENAIKVGLEHLTTEFMASMSAALESETCLADQVAAVAVLICAYRRRADSWRFTDGSENILVLLLGVSGDHVMREAIDLWTPLVKAARDAGEVGGRITPKKAAEWIVRILFSFELLPPMGVNLDNPRAVRGFVKDHIIAGLI